MDEQESKQLIVFEAPPFFYLYEDGSVERRGLSPPTPPSPHDGVAFKDVTLNAELGLWARLYLPHPPPPPPLKLPLLLYFPGGGFIIGGPAITHPFCTAVAKLSGAIIVSASYRLAPEHRLPRAYDDGMQALQWLHSQALLQAEGAEERMDGWLVQADFSKCFVAGESAGGNVAHRVVMRALNKTTPSSANAPWAPLCIKGFIPIHPGFMRQTRTREEEESGFDRALDWNFLDMMCVLALPVGVTSKDHRFVNPLGELSAGTFSHLPPKALVALADGDRLHFMGLEYAQALEKGGCCVDVFMSEGVGHGFYYFEPNTEEANLLYRRIAKFISEE